MKKWEIIREAKKYLAKNAKDEYKNKKTEFVCNAIKRVHADDIKIVQLCKHINYLIKDEVTLSSWLLNKAKLDKNEFQKDQDRGYPKLQATRLAWMNWMEEHYKSLDQ